MKGQGRCVPMVLALLWCDAQIAWPQPPADFTRGVSVTLGATDQENGLRLVGIGRGAPAPVVDKGGRSCRRTDKATRRWWMSFMADPAYAAKESLTGLSSEVTYFDAGEGPINLMYKARVRGISGIQNHLRIGQRTGTDTWKTLRVALPDADFAGPDIGWHLRLSGDSWGQWQDLYVGEVRLDRKGVWLTAGPDTVAARNPEPCVIRALITDEAGQPVQEPATVMFRASAGRIEPEVTTKEGAATVSFLPPATPGDVEVTATCAAGEARTKVTVVSGSGKVVLRKRVLGFEADDTLDAAKSVKRECERLELSLSDSKRYEGAASARMDYSFKESVTGEGSVYVGKEVPGRPLRFHVQVDSEGPACEVEFLLKDVNGQETLRHGCTLWQKGWSKADNMLDSPQLPWFPEVQKPLQYPLSFEHVLLRGMPGYGTRYKRSGTIHSDYLVAEFLAAESEVQPIPLEVTAGQQGEKLMVTLKNVSKQPCTARSSCWLANPVGVWIGPLPITKPFELKPGEVVEFPLSFPEIPEDPQKMKPGEYAVEIAAVVVETGDLVEIQSKWRKQ